MDPGWSYVAFGPPAVGAFGLMFRDLELVLSKACGEIPSDLVQGLVGASLEEFTLGLLTVLEQAEPKRSGLRRTNRKSRRLPGNAGAELRAHASSDR